MASAEKSHPFHMVEPSRWPLIGTIGAFTTAVGLVAYMKGGSAWGLILGLAIVLFTMAGWWRDVIREGRSGEHTARVRIGLREGMVFFIASEVMFFVAWFWAFFHNALPAFNRVAPEQWPPAGVESIEAWGLPFINTVILLTSGVTVTWAHHAVQKGNNAKTAFGILLTILLGATFLGIQGYEYGHAAFGFTDGIYPSVFFMATGFHGFHVFVGVCFLTVCLVRAARNQFSPEGHVGFEAAAWYWHFVDVVWLFLFVWIYWWGGS
jgi:cytochrome c oxidase subunit 3